MATTWNQTTFLSNSGGEVANFISGGIAPASAGSGGSSGGSGGSSGGSGGGSSNPVGSTTITDDTSIDFGDGFNAPPYQVAFQSTGKMIVVGNFSQYSGTTSMSGTNIYGIARINTDGSIDTSFNSNGSGGFKWQIQPNGGPKRKVKVDPITDDVLICHGGIPTAGTSENSTIYSDYYYDRNVNSAPITYLPRLYKLDKDGDFDTTFNSNITSIFGSGASSLNPIHRFRDFDFQSDGKILVVSSKQGHIFRLNSNGTLDTTFPNGFLSGSQNSSKNYPHFGTGWPHTIKVLPDDSFVFDIADNTHYSSSAGIIDLGFTTSSGDFAKRTLRKANSDGTLDTTFNYNESNYISSWRSNYHLNNTPNIKDIQEILPLENGTIVIGGPITSLSGSSTTDGLEYSNHFYWRSDAGAVWRENVGSQLTQISSSDATYIPTGSSGYVVNDLGINYTTYQSQMVIYPGNYDYVSDLETDKVGNIWYAGYFTNYDESGSGTISDGNSQPITKVGYYTPHSTYGRPDVHMLRLNPDGTISQLPSGQNNLYTNQLNWSEPPAWSRVNDIDIWHDTSDIKITAVGSFNTVAYPGGIMQFKIANAYGFKHTVGTYNNGRYELSCNKSTSVTEGETITWTLHTRGVPTGNVAYTISGITSADLSNGSLTGNFTVNYHTYKWGSQVSITLADDSTYETENITLTLDGTGISQTFSITDTTSQSSGGGGGVAGLGVYSNDWMEVSGSTTFNLVSGSEMIYKITLTDNSYWSNTSVDVTSGDFYFRNFNYPVNNATHGAVLRATDRSFTEIQFDLDDSYGTITGSHLFFHDGVAEFKVIYNDSFYPAYTSSAITNGDYLTYKPGLWRLYQNGTGAITYSPETGGVSSNDYRNIAHSSSINWTLQDWPSTSTTSSISQKLTLYPNKTIYWVSRSLDDGASGYPSGQTYSSINTLNTPMKIGDYIYDATGSIRSTYSDFVATHNAGISSYFDFSDPSPYAPHRHAAISKGQVIKTWYNDAQKQGNWNPVIKSLFTGSYEWTVDSPEYSRVRTFEVQSKEGWWYRFNTRGTTTLRSTVEPTLYLTESGDNGTTFTQGTHYTDDVFGDISQGWAKEIVSMSVSTNTPPTSATNYSTTREIYYLSSNSKRDFGWTNYISGVSGSLLFYTQTGSYGEQNVIESYTSASDTDYLAYYWRRSGIPSGQSDEGDVNYHETSPDTITGNHYLHYNGAMYMRTQKGLPYPMSNTQGDTTFVWKYDTQSLDNTQGIFYLGTDINGNIISGSANYNIGGAYNYPDDLSGFAWSSTTKFTCGTGNKWPANGDTIYYYDGPLAGNAFTAPSNGTWYVVLTTEIPTTDLTLHSSTWNRMQINTDGSIGTVLNPIS